MSPNRCQIMNSVYSRKENVPILPSQKLSPVRKDPNRRSCPNMYHFLWLCFFFFFFPILTGGEVRGHNDPSVHTPQSVDS